MLAFHTVLIRMFLGATCDNPFNVPVPQYRFPDMATPFSMTTGTTSEQRGQPCVRTLGPNLDGWPSKTLEMIDSKTDSMTAESEMRS